MSLKRDVVRSTIWSAVQIGGNQATSFVVFLVLTRLLTPQDIGVVTVAAALIEIGLPLMRGGFPEAIVQRAQLNPIQSSTCFWATLGASLVLMVIVVLLATPLADVLNIPSSASVLQALALIFPLSALTATHEALIVRSFGFKSLALRGLIANTIGGLLGLAAAMIGWGIWALVIQRIVTSMASVVVIWLSYRWIPKLQFSPAEFRSLSRFGINMMGITFLQSLNGRATDFVLSFFLGSQAVGYMRVASRCLDMITQFVVSPLLSVALTTFSRLQNDQPRLERAMSRMVQICGVLSFPTYFGLGVVAGDLVPLAFGPQWKASADLLPILSLYAIPTTLQFFTWPALAAKGRSDKAALGIAIVVAAAVLATGVSAPLGLFAVAIASVVRSYVVLPLGFALLRRYAGVRPGALIMSTIRPLVCAVVMVAVLLVEQHFLGGLSPGLRTVVLTVTGLVVYAGLMATFFRGVVVEMFDVLRG